jgi:hypothetical protein
MTNFKLGHWLLVALAIVGLAFAAPVVSAHGDVPTQGNETATDEMPTDGDAASWAAWIESHMTDHMGPGAVEEMESHMGVTVDEMAQDMAAKNHNTGSTHTAGPMHTTGGMNGQGHGC